MNAPTRNADAVPSIGIGFIWHARRRPAGNEFRYASYFLRLPLRALAQSRWPYRWLAHNRAGVFSLKDADHGDGRPLLSWIDALLAQHGVADADGEIWLHTLPRVLGYVFNPISFWFCHRADGALRAVVCEVNNTFGERHAYLLAHGDGRPLAWGEELAARKALHVSPFCAVAGGYRFRFTLLKQEGGARFVARIDHHDDAGLLLQTAVSGTLRPLTDRQLARAFFLFPAFTFGVIARIHWQALRLWLKRVPFFSKPQPPATGLTRST